MTEEQHRALDALGINPEDVSEDDISEAGRVFVKGKVTGIEYLIDLDGDSDEDFAVADHKHLRAEVHEHARRYLDSSRPALAELYADWYIDRYGDRSLRDCPSHPDVMHTFRSEQEASQICEFCGEQHDPAAECRS